MQTTQQANAQPNSRIPLNLVCVYPGGFAWPASDSRRGRYITCPNIASEPMGLAVVNDFGNLVPVPSTGSISPIPATGLTR